ncbi:unnamed protein product [Dicrocoelium dendriticum]|nr:unnamed protein product [Dicrocoelium dendriticum]
MLEISHSQVPTMPPGEKTEKVTAEMKETVKATTTSTNGTTKPTTLVPTTTTHSSATTTSANVTTKPTTLVPTTTTESSRKLHVSLIGVSLVVMCTASLALICVQLEFSHSLEPSDEIKKLIREKVEETLKCECIVFSFAR